MLHIIHSFTHMPIEEITYFSWPVYTSLDIIRVMGQGRRGRTGPGLGWMTSYHKHINMNFHQVMKRFPHRGRISRPMSTEGVGSSSYVNVDKMGLLLEFAWSCMKFVNKKIYLFYATPALLLRGKQLCGPNLQKKKSNRFYRG